MGHTLQTGICLRSPCEFCLSLSLSLWRCETVICVWHKKTLQMLYSAWMKPCRLLHFCHQTVSSKNDISARFIVGYFKRKLCSCTTQCCKKQISAHSKHALFQKSLAVIASPNWGVIGNLKSFTWSCQDRQSRRVSISKHRIYSLRLSPSHACVSAGIRRLSSSFCQHP